MLDGELLWDQHTHRADDIATAIRISEEFGYRLVVNHGTEGHLIADLLAEKNIPVIFGPMFTTRVKVELRNRTMRAAGIMAKAGVKVAITTDHPVVPIHFLVHQATLAVKEGMDRAAALRALTVHPAEILRLDDQVGSLKPGLDGDVVIWSGDPLDVMSRALRVFIRGREVYSYDEDTAAATVGQPVLRVTTRAGGHPRPRDAAPRSGRPWRHVRRSPRRSPPEARSARSLESVQESDQFGVHLGGAFLLGPVAAAGQQHGSPRFGTYVDSLARWSRMPGPLTTRSRSPPTYSAGCVIFAPCHGRHQLTTCGPGCGTSSGRR